jgi:integrase
LKDGLIGSNPASRVGEEYRQARNLHEEINPLSQSEIEMYQRAAAEEPLQYSLFLQTAIQAGLRVGELCGLKWNDVDFERKRIHVRRTINKDGKKGPPKSKKGVRFVRMNDFLVQAFRKWKQLQHEQYGKVEFVFCSLSGKSRININQIRKIHAGILQRAKLQRIRLHDLRHTYATFLLQKGTSVWWVSRQMGHSSIQVTIDTYFHYLPDEDDRDAALLNKFPSATES